MDPLLTNLHSLAVHAGLAWETWQVGSGYTARDLRDGQTLASPGHQSVPDRRCVEGVRLPRQLALNPKKERWSPLEQLWIIWKKLDMAMPCDSGTILRCRTRPTKYLTSRAGVDRYSGCRNSAETTSSRCLTRVSSKSRA